MRSMSDEKHHEFMALGDTEPQGRDSRMNPIAV